MEESGLCESCSKKRTASIRPIATREELFEKAKELELEPEKAMGKGRLIDLIYKKTVRPHLVEPCFFVDPPVEVEPLAKRKPENPKVVERFQIMAAGTELGKGFSELNDPLDQRARFEEQMKLRAAGRQGSAILGRGFCGSALVRHAARRRVRRLRAILCGPHGPSDARVRVLPVDAGEEREIKALWKIIQKQSDQRWGRGFLL